MVLYNFFSRGRHAGIPHGVVLGVYLPIIYRQCHPEYPIFFYKTKRNSLEGINLCGSPSKL